ncbi:10387_t:CDS:2 [Acaulospora colombiana]|uniref:10387_t:CDS:1 n=1 Tax=Acaulospora colombiana TaxID=27376 RepID=A0ACA9KPH5_9GLOM|nr:10387_t:CDS:2 [Acaulospora colombiana]
MNSNESFQYQNLDIKHLTNLEVSREFYDNLQPITALDFDGNGEFCVTASADETINLYNCQNGKQPREIFGQQEVWRTSHKVHSLKRRNSLRVHKRKWQSHGMFSLNKWIDTLRYLSLRDNQFIRTDIIFHCAGFNHRVVALEMSPVDDQFMTGSVNEGVRLWDLKQPNDVGFIDLKSERPCVGYDPSGLVFAIAIQHPDRIIQLYDSRKFDESPFSTFKVEDSNANPIVSSPPTTAKLSEWTGIKFSNDGQKILITTSGDAHYIIDAFDGKIKQRLVGHVGLDNAIARWENTFLGYDSAAGINRILGID